MSSWGLQGVSAGYGSRAILKNIELTFRKGEIHALVGENGAGKSTALKVIAGLLSPSSGNINLGPKTVASLNPLEAKEEGVALVHQHFLLSKAHSGLDNLRLHSSDLSEFSSFSSVKRKALELMDRYGLKVDLETETEKLSMGEQQRLEIIRVLSQKAQLVMLDEPSALLAPAEVESLYTLLTAWKVEGRAIVVVTHKLAEVFRWCDRFTVLKKGEVVLSGLVAQSSPSRVGEAMVGHALPKREEKEDSAPSNSRKPLLKLRNVFSRTSPAWGVPVEGISLQVHSGEIVGIAGVEGSGQRALLECLINPKEALQNGSLDWFETQCTSWSREKIRGLSLGLIPPDRHHEAILENWSVKENFRLSSHAPQSEREVQALLSEYLVDPSKPDLLLSELSGGNQQKVVAAREIGSNPSFLIACNPTRGIDFLSASTVRNHIRKLAKKGSGVLLLSSDLEELLEISHRILVIYGGRFIGEQVRRDFSEPIIGRWMGGAQ